MSFYYDRYPLESQRGNFSGKASAFIQSIINGEWWLSDASTGFVPEYVEKNNQFHINQGPVDMSIKNAQETHAPTSLAELGGYEPKQQNAGLDWLAEKAKNWVEVFVWHPFTKKVEKPLEFSVIPTQY